MGEENYIEVSLASGVCERLTFRGGETISKTKH